jgi:hypothetical protein
MFPITSRYYGVAIAKLETATDVTIAYLRRRLVPPPERFELLQEHIVSEGERLDQVAAQFLGDPEQFWRLADANGATQPDDLMRPPGRRIRITLPEGIPGAPDA